MSNLKSFLSPKSIAIIGASRDREKLGRLVLENVKRAGFKGKVYPVNPKANKVAGLKCYHSVSDINREVDLAVIAIPAPFVLDVVKECAKSRIKNVAIISAGFSEIGKEGLKVEFEMQRIAQESGISILGPNCLGIISTPSKLNATFAKNEIRKGNIAFLSQSGAMGTAALDWAIKNGIGFAHFISIGNKAHLSENDFLNVLSKDPSTDVIALYLEDFVDGKAFIKAAKEVKKPIIVLKPGRTKEAQEALSLHTGSLAQDDLIISAALKQSGVIRVDTIEELFNLMKFFSLSTKPQGNKVAVVTNAGGPGVVTTDIIKSLDLDLMELSNRTRKMLALNLPKSASVRNPVDVLGDALADRYKFAINEVVKDRNVDVVVVLLTPQVMTEVEKTSKIISQIASKTKKPIISVFIGGDEVEKGTKVLSQKSLLYYTFPSAAIKTLSYIWKFKKLRANGTKRRVVADRKKDVYNKARKLLSGKKGVLDVQDVQKLFKAYEIPILVSTYPIDIADLRRNAKRLKYPVVLKLVHKKLLHKTDVDAVKLNIKNQNELEAVYSDLLALSKKLKLDGGKIEMQHFVKDALELIIGVKKNQDIKASVNGKEVVTNKGFGSGIMFGMGGIYTEVYKDFALRIAPLSKLDINAMIGETKVSEILKGARGQRYNIKAVRDVISKVSQLVTDFPEIEQLDINPLFVKEDEVWAVDAKVILGNR